MVECIIVGAGGFIGAVMRYLIGIIPMTQESGFPIKTFVINIAGAFLIGIVAALAARNSLDPKVSLFLKVGICGGFTTFSSFALETNQLMAKGQVATSVCCFECPVWRAGGACGTEIFCVISECLGEKDETFTCGR